MLLTIQNPTASSKTLITSKQNKCLIGITKNISALNKARVLSSVISDFAENIASLLYAKKNLNKYNSLVSHLTKSILKTSLSNKYFTELIKNSWNLEDLLELSNPLTHSRQIISCEQFLKTRFYSIFCKMVDWNASSNALVEEIILNTRFGSKRHPQTIEMQKTQSWLNSINSCISKNDQIERTSVPALDFVDTDNNENQKFNLLCIFTNETGYGETSSDFNKTRHNEDIRMILPMTWNIVVAYNVLTISDENSQHITIYFRNPLKAKFDYKYSNLPSSKKSSLNRPIKEANILKGRVQSSRIKKLNSPLFDPIVNGNLELFNRRNDKIIHKPPKQLGEKKIGSDSFLCFDEPILLNYIEQNKTKQMLMYKAHSTENASRGENQTNNNFCKILEELLAKSVQYDGEPVHLIFEPLTLITRLKKEEKISGLNLKHHVKCKHDLMRNRIYKKLLQYKNIQMFRDMHHENKAFRTMLPKDECATHIKDTDGMTGKSVITTHNGLDLPKNFSTSVIRKCFEVNGNTVHAKYTSEMSDKPIIETNDCLDLPKNFSTSVMRKDFSMDELFRENKSNLKFHRRRMSRTALKQINAKRIVSSVFRHFFHFYSLHGGNLRSGTVITRFNSNYWLQVSGVATDSGTLKLAGELFTTVAGKKVVLNIFDYIKFLVVFARTRRLIITELVKQMMTYEQLSEPLFSMEKCKKCTTLKTSENEPTEFSSGENHLPISRSLPSMWNTNLKIVPSKVNSCVRSRNCFSQDIF